MLGLATHEPNFTIIREEFKPNKPKPCALCNQMGHEVKDCQGLPREKQGKVRILLFLGFFKSVVCKEILKSFLLLVLAEAWCKLWLGIPGFPLGGKNTKVSWQTWYPHLWRFVWGFFPLNENEWSEPNVRAKQQKTCLVKYTLLSKVGLEQLWGALGSNVSPLCFQHDQFADTLPVSEQEFIFIRLCVLREVRHCSCCL